MTVLGFAVSLVLATLGRALLAWRAAASKGFGLGVVNTPLIFGVPFASRVIWLVGQALFWAGLYLAYRVFAAPWYWVVGIGVLSYGLGRLIVSPIVGPELDLARRERQKLADKDGLMAAMEMHHEQGSITKEQLEEFRKFREGQGSGTTPTP
jgi:hypothetical protein